MLCTSASLSALWYFYSVSPKAAVRLPRISCSSCSLPWSLLSWFSVRPLQLLIHEESAAELLTAKWYWRWCYCLIYYSIPITMKFNLGWSRKKCAACDVTYLRISAFRIQYLSAVISLCSTHRPSHRKICKHIPKDVFLLLIYPNYFCGHAYFLYFLSERNKWRKQLATAGSSLDYAKGKKLLNNNKQITVNIIIFSVDKL